MTEAGVTSPAATATANLAVGLDLGTSGLKGVVLDRSANLLASARASYPTRRDEPGASEQDPADWLRAARLVLAELAAQTDPTQWAGIGLSGMLPTLVTVDVGGRAVGPAITWEDARAEVEGELFAAAVGADALYASTGQRVDGRYLIPMYLRVARTDPVRVARTATLLGAKDYLFGWLTGALLTDPSTAAGYGCYDLRAGDWSAGFVAAADDLAAAAGADLPALPPVVDSREQRPMRAALTAELQLPPGLPVAVGGADSVLGALGLGAARAGDVAYLAGTSTVILGVAAELPSGSDRRFLITPLAGMPGWGLEMDLLSTGSTLGWLAQLSQGPAGDMAALVSGAAELDPDDAPVLLPYLAPGEQGALWDPTLAGTVFGLSLHHDRRHLARAAQTGIVLESRRCLDVLTEVGGPGDIWLGGGGALHPLLPTELAAATRRVVHPADGADGRDSAGGAARLVWPASATAASADDGRDRAAAITVTDPAEHARWDRRAERHDAALAAARGFYDVEAGSRS